LWPVERFTGVCVGWTNQQSEAPEPNAIKDFFPVNTGVFLYLQE